MNTISNEEQKALKKQEVIATTEEFLLGALIKAVSAPFKAASKSWMAMSQDEQAKLMGYVGDAARLATHDAVRAIAAGDRTNFRASVEKVEFKADGVKSAISMLNTMDAHALADAAGRTVLIVIEDGDHYLQFGDALEGEPDQRALL